MLRRLVCLLLGHRWLRAAIGGALYPAVEVAWPHVCARCGARWGL